MWFVSDCEFATCTFTIRADSMTAQNRFLLLLTYVLCFAVTVRGIFLDPSDAETCDVLCAPCNASAIFANGQCECSFNEINDEDAECIRRLGRKTQIINLNAFSNNPPEERAHKERSVRSILKFRRRLKTGDGEKVAQYFINGGPLIGHSHFIKHSDADYDSADSTANSSSDIRREDNFENKSTDAQSYPLGTSSSSGSRPESSLYMMSKTAPMISSPAMLNAKTYIPTLRIMNPILDYPVSVLYSLPGPTMGLFEYPSEMRSRKTPLYILPRATALPSYVLQYSQRYSRRFPV